MKPRITAGPIEDLGIAVENFERIGYVAMRTSFSSNETLIVKRLEGEEVVKDLPNCKIDMIIETVHDYLKRTDRYLAHARSTTSGIFGFQQMTGDLYREK